MESAQLLERQKAKFPTSQVTPNPLWNYQQVIGHRPETGPTVRLLELPARSMQVCNLGEPGALGPLAHQNPQGILRCSFQMQERMKAEPSS